MNEVLANSYFKEFIIPLLAVFVTIGVKVVSRKDTFIQINRDDFAIGFDLIVSSLILLVTYSSKVAFELKIIQITMRIARINLNFYRGFSFLL